MTYGIDKQRDMMRSILPSTRRDTARKDLARAKRKERRKVNHKLTHISRLVDVTQIEDIYDEDVELDFRNDREIKDAMWERRTHDKVMPLIRWAEAQVKDRRILDRLSGLYGMLPDNTIGRHAASHVELSDAFYIPYYNSWYERLTPEERKAREKYRAACEYAQVVEDLRKVVEDNRQHRQFNDVLKRPISYYRRVRILPSKDNKSWGNYKDVLERRENGRPLRGMHDIEACIAWHSANHKRRERFKLAYDSVVKGVNNDYVKWAQARAREHYRTNLDALM